MSKSKEGCPGAGENLGAGGAPDPTPHRDLGTGFPAITFLHPFHLVPLLGAVSCTANCTTNTYVQRCSWSICNGKKNKDNPNDKNR